MLEMDPRLRGDDSVVIAYIEIFSYYTKSYIAPFRLTIFIPQNGVKYYFVK
jgi:hypothetical protein